MLYATKHEANKKSVLFFIVTAIDELKTFVDEQVTEGKVDCSRILSEVRQLQL